MGSSFFITWYRICTNTKIHHISNYKKMKRKISLLLLTLITVSFPCILKGQYITYIKITDKNKNSIENAFLIDTITKKIIGVSNENGDIKIIHDRNISCVIKHISYLPYYLSLPIKKDTITIQLTNAIINFPDIEIRDWTNMLLKAIDMIPKNTCQKTTLYKGVFISAAKANNKPIFFQQAHITTQIRKYGENNQLFIALDSSFVLRKNAGDGADTSSAYLRPASPLNLAYSMCHSFKKNSKDYNISLKEILSGVNGKQIYLISYANKINGGDSGKVYIEDSTYAILKIVLYKKWKDYEVKGHGRVGFISDYIENHTFTYAKRENQLYELTSVNSNIKMTLKLGDFVSKESATFKYVSTGECKTCTKIKNQDIVDKILSTPYLDKSSPFAIEKEVFEDEKQ